MTDRIGFIGLGIMGRPMARNLMKAGFPLTVWNRSRPGVDELVSEGAAEGGSPADVARRSDVVITIVGNSPDVEEVTLGAKGIVEGAHPGLVHIDMTTMSPQVTRRIAGRLAEAGVEMLDAPVSGGQQGAIEGTLSIMVGGKAETLERCRPVLAAMGGKIVHCGPSGAGQTVKLCNQVAVVLTNLTEEEGIPPEDIAVLTPSGSNKSRLRALGSVNGFRLSETVEPGTVLATSVHAFKGLERPVVILAELGDKHLEDLNRYLYVGGSRARNHLIVLASEPVARELRRLTGLTGS